MPVKLNSAGGGSVTLTTPSTASDFTLTVPAVTGSALVSTSGSSTSSTGIDFPSANTVSIKTNGTTAVTVDSSQRVGIGTASPVAVLSVFSASNSPTSVGNGVRFLESTNGYGVNLGGNSAGYAWIQGIYGGSSTLGYNDISIQPNGGNLLVGVTSTYSAVGVTTTHSFSSNTATTWAGAFQNKSSTTPCGVLVRYDTDPNGTGSSFLYCQGNATLRAEIRSNGGIANYSGNNVALSDERLKTNINNAGEYLDKICAIPVRTFKYKDQTKDELNIGVIAQEVEAIAPELVDTDGFGALPDDGIPLKAIYQTDLQYALMKCIQELSAKLDAAEARIAALEAK